VDELLPEISTQQDANTTPLAEQPAGTEQPTKPPDVFVSYSPEDEDWVEDWLVPCLEKAGLSVWTKYNFEPGVDTVINIERAVEYSYRTVIVLTPSGLDSAWNQYASILSQSDDPSARRRKFIPLLLRKCELPKRIKWLTPADFTVERRWEKACNQLIRSIEKAIPIPFPARRRDIRAWWRWARRYRWRLVVGALGLFVLWVLLFTALDWPPFQKRMVWLAEDFHAPNALALYNTGTTLLIGGRNEGSSCNYADNHLWYRPLASEGAWKQSDVGTLLCIEEWTATGQERSNIRAFAALPDDPNTVYALTSHSDLLMSTNAGGSFARYKAPFPAELHNPNNPRLLVVSGTAAAPVVWVAGDDRGLWVYRKEQWFRLDQAQGGCANLPAELLVKSLLVKDQLVLIGSHKQGLWASDDGGATCHEVFDTNPIADYEFYGLWDISTTTHARYLALVHYTKESGIPKWRLLVLCPRLGMCSAKSWKDDRRPLWSGWYGPPLEMSNGEAVLVQRTSSQDYEWYLVDRWGGLWKGGMQNDSVVQLPGITHCAYKAGRPCQLALTRAAAEPTDRPPYLLADEYVYQFTNGIWWRYWWN
jgi:hypothetical protein